MAKLTQVIMAAAVMFALSACNEQKDSDTKEPTQTLSGTTKEAEPIAQNNAHKKLPVVVLGQEIGKSTPADLKEIGCAISASTYTRHKNAPTQWEEYSNFSRGSFRAAPCALLKQKLGLRMENMWFIYDEGKLVEIHFSAPSYEINLDDVLRALKTKYNYVRESNDYALFNNGDGVSITLSINGTFTHLTYSSDMFAQKERELQHSNDELLAQKL